MSAVAATTSVGELEQAFEQHRRELLGYCYRMLGTPFDAEDAVQETMLRAWRGIDNFQGRAALRSWLYRIATNVCMDSLTARGRRARPMDLGPASEPVAENLNVPNEITWIEPIPDSMVAGSDPAEQTMARETLRLAFIAALQRLPARQRAALILCEVFRWKATEAADLLETSVASINSALQRARATLEEADVSSTDQPATIDADQRELLARYVAAFEAYDIDALTALIREDAIQSMPPFDMWLAGRENIFTWWLGPGIGCKGSKMLPAPQANGTVAFGQYKPDPENGGYAPWALQVLEIGEGGLGELTFFLDTERLFPLFGLPAAPD
jgi:RNA polymerase sigma-70 factor, ECF subfamily